MKIKITIKKKKNNKTKTITPKTKSEKLNKMRATEKYCDQKRSALKHLFRLTIEIHNS